MSGTRMKKGKMCAVCGKPMNGLPIASRYCSDKCRIEHDREYARKRYAAEKAKKPPRSCKFCGAPVAAPRKQMCPICTELRREKTVAQMRDKKMIAEAREKAKKRKTAEMQVETEERRVSFSAHWTLEELARLAKLHNTSYGKIVAFIDKNRRLPGKGEMRL